MASTYCSLLYYGLITALMGILSAIPPYPTWPDKYKSCVNVETAREFIKAGWYVDAEKRRMRLDSYGIPKGMNASTVELFQYYVNHVESFEYACEDYGPPLYIFIYLYDISRMLSLFPSPDPPYRKCTVSSIYNKFPSNPLVQDVEFVEEGHDNITTYNHWRSEFFLFTLDYLFHVSNGLPYRLIVNDEQNTFLSFNKEELAPDTFSLPPGVVCS